MTDKHITVDAIRWHSVLPWLHLFRAAQLALRVRVTLLTLIAVAVFAAGQLAIQRLPFHAQHESRPSVLEVFNFKSVDPHRFDLDPHGGKNVEWLAWPWITAGRPGAELFTNRPGAVAKSWSAVATH